MKILHYCIVSILLASSSVIPGFAQEVIEDRVQVATDEVEWNPCEFSGQRQLNSIETISDMFITHAEEKIVQKIFTHEAYKDLIRSYTDDFVETLENTLDVCKDGQTDLYNRTAPMNMNEVVQSLKIYALVIGGLRQLEKRHATSDTVTQKMDILQGHMLGNILSQIKNNTFLSKETTMNLDVMFTSPNMNVDGSLTLDTTEKGYILGTNIESENSIKLVVDGNHVTQGSLAMEISTQVSVRIVDNHIYIKLDGSDIDISSVPVEMHTEAVKLQESLKLISGKWIDMGGDMLNPIPGSAVLGVGGFGEGSIQQLVQELLSQPVLIEYSSENTVSFAGMNPLVCSSLGMFGGVRDCLENMRWEQYESTDGKGLVMIQQYKDGYTFAVTDRHMSDEDKMPSEESVIYSNTTLLGWNDDEITFIDIPFMDFGGFTYKDGKINMTADIVEERYDRETDTSTTSTTELRMQGTTDTNKHVLDLAGTIKNDEVDVSFTWNHIGAPTNMDTQMTLDIVSTDEYSPFSMSLTLDAQTDQKEINRVDIVAPPTSETIKLETLMENFAPEYN